MQRCVEAELLDELPPENSRARQSRRDLRRVNAVMGHARLMAGCLSGAFPVRAPARLVELGCGDGTFLLQVARRLASRWHGLQAVLLDRQPLVKPETLEQFNALGWSAEVLTVDLFDWLKDAGSFDAVVANLFLHHFTEEQLALVFEAASRRTDFFAAFEPRRARIPLLFSRMLWVIGCNQVTRHDAPVSVRAGFKAFDLSKLWPREEAWLLEERPAAWFSHLFVARRQARRGSVCPH